MIAELLGLLLVGLTLAGCIMMYLVVCALGYLLWLHLGMRPEGAASESRALAQPLPADPDLPHVVVQIPAFNEGSIIERAIDAAAKLDWPRDKLHVQVCDDSTDGTTGMARKAAERARATGVEVTVLHRDQRDGFKAGALNAAREATPHPYFAILDVDYVPGADFLRRCMGVLLAEPRLAFVQARPDYLNAGESWLTRAQAILLDFHYGLEQPTRSWSGQALPFNGTCGIWRRAAIEAGGGWRGDMVTEDWDLSYRVLMSGWRGRYVAGVGVPGEIPNRLDAWLSQQDRWAAGIGEVACRMIPAVMSDPRLSTGDRIRALFPFGTWIGSLIFLCTVFCAVAAMLLMPAQALAIGLTAYSAVIALSIALFAVMRAANLFLGRQTPLLPFVRDFATVLSMCIYISWANLRSLPATLAGRRRVFVRTPKEGAARSAC